MVAVPCNRILDDLPVHTSVAAQLILCGPLFKIEEVTEELEDIVFLEQVQSQRAAEMAFEQGCRFFKLGQHPRRGISILFGLASKCCRFRRFQRQAPMQVDAAETC